MPNAYHFLSEENERVTFLSQIVYEREGVGAKAPNMKYFLVPPPTPPGAERTKDIMTTLHKVKHFLIITSCLIAQA